MDRETRDFIVNRFEELTGSCPSCLEDFFQCDIFRSAASDVLADLCEAVGVFTEEVDA